MSVHVSERMNGDQLIQHVDLLVAATKRKSNLKSNANERAVLFAGTYEAFVQNPKTLEKEAPRVAAAINRIVLHDELDCQNYLKLVRCNADLEERASTTLITASKKGHEGVVSFLPPVLLNKKVSIKTGTSYRVSLEALRIFKHLVENIPTRLPINPVHLHKLAVDLQEIENQHQYKPLSETIQEANIACKNGLQAKFQEQDLPTDKSRREYAFRLLEEAKGDLYTELNEHVSEVLLAPISLMTPITELKSLLDKSVQLGGLRPQLPWGIVNILVSKIKKMDSDHQRAKEWLSLWEYAYVGHPWMKGVLLGNAPETQVLDAEIGLALISGNHCHGIPELENIRASIKKYSLRIKEQNGIVSLTYTKSAKEKYLDSEKAEHLQELVKAINPTIIIAKRDWYVSSSSLDSWDFPTWPLCVNKSDGVTKMRMYDPIEGKTKTVHYNLSHSRDLLGYQHLAKKIEFFPQMEFMLRQSLGLVTHTFDEDWKRKGGHARPRRYDLDVRAWKYPQLMQWIEQPKAEHHYGITQPEEENENDIEAATCTML